MSVDDDRHRYSAAWIDLVAKGRHLGRASCTRGITPVRRLDAKAQVTPFRYDPHSSRACRPLVPRPGSSTTRRPAFNEFWFRKAPRHRVGELQTIAEFFHPLDMIGSWNRLYGRPGLVQYQFVVPFGEETRCGASSSASPRAVSRASSRC
jgi:decaprenylphospho-beta-D-ribofuranose 2-oxidase